MTFSEFIKQVDIQDFNLWFENKDEGDLVYNKSEIWKYNITKNGKIFPFKVALKAYLKDHNLGELTEFKSNYDTRHKFCQKFGFRIHEDLVYDNTEFETFKKFYEKEIYNKVLFQNFIKHCSKILKSCNAEPYNIRMAISSSDRDAMVLMGQRAVAVFSRRGKNSLSFLVSKSFDLSNIFHELRYEFQGDDYKQMIEINVEKWEQIPELLLEHNKQEAILQYNIVKDKKISQWNQEATTTNSVLKYLIFKNIDVGNLLSTNKKTVMQYFDLEGISNLRKKHNENLLQETLQKLDYLKNELSIIVDANFSISNIFTDKKNNRIDIGFNVNQGLDIIIIGFYGDTDDDVFFRLEVEPNGGFDSEEISKINENYALTFSHSEFPQSWEELIEKLKKPVEEIANTLTGLSNNVKSNNNVIQQPLNQILYGPPGTGKTYNTVNKAISIANPHFELNQGREILKVEFDRLVEAGQIVFTTFHQSMSYEDFVEGIKPVMTEDEGELNYEVQNGIFKEICKAATEISEVKVVDNFDDSWGKLIALVKEHIADERLLKIGSWEYGLSTKESLKYSSLNSPSQYTFTITKQNILDTYQNKQARPSGAFQKDMEDVVNYMKANLQLSDYKEDSNVNQYKSENKNHVLIIDEINRGNVSQIFGELITLIEEGKRIGNSEELQVTLPYSKKKFGVPANLYIIGTMNTADRSVEALDTALRRRFSFVEMMPDLSVVEKENFQDHLRVDIMQKINERIELLLDRNYTLGHSYFIKENFKASFKNEIIPLLQEYFYNDCGKIGLILGQGFVREKEISKVNHQKIFADFDTRNEIEVIKSYELTPFEEIDFENALEQLLA